MRKFLIKFCIFILPIIFFFGGIEWYVRNLPNAFITKSKYLKENLNSIQTLVLGTSHSQYGINPKLFTTKTANISYASQDIFTDEKLFFKYVPSLPELRTVIFEYDYHRMDIMRQKDYYNIPWYHMFYGIKEQNIPFYKRFSLYFTNPLFFNQIILQDINEGKEMVNDYGFVEKDDINEFEKLDYNEDKIENYYKNKIKNRHKENSSINFNKNRQSLLKIINYCNRNKLRLIFVSSPLYKTYIDGEIKHKKQKVDAEMKNMINKYGVEYYDYSRDTRFNVFDFGNSDHLNVKGAQKYSKILDSLTK